MHLHLYFNSEKHGNDAKEFNCRMLQCREEMLSGHRVPEHEKGYRNYFEIKETPKCGASVTYRKDKIDEAHERYGFFILLSNDVKDPITALKLYKMRNITEKAFWNYKNRLSLRRALTSSESSLEGKLFVEFVEFIHPCLNKKIEDGHLYSRYTIHELLDELDVIECYLEPGMVPIQVEVFMKQEQFIEIWGLGRCLLPRNNGSY